MFRHIINAIFFWKLVNKTGDCFNNIVFILLVKISSKKIFKKMENNATLEKVLLVCNKNVAINRSNFWLQSGFPQKDEKEILIILKSLHKKVVIFCLICLSLLTLELSNLNWKCSEICNMLTERIYDSVVFKIFLNIITICIFIAQ